MSLLTRKEKKSQDIGMTSTRRRTRLVFASLRRWLLTVLNSRPRKVSLDYYRRESTKILNMFKEGLPGAEIGEVDIHSSTFDGLFIATSEKASIDEAFIDFTRPVRAKLLETYPHLATVPHDAPDGMDTELPPPPPIHWDGLGAVVPVFPPPEPTQEVGRNEDEDFDDSITTWHDVALTFAAQMMSKVRAEIHDRLGYSTSAVRAVPVVDKLPVLNA